MGMFDSFYGADGSEWQTKALGRSLDRWEIGDSVPGPPIDYQAEVIGGRGTSERGHWSFVTMRAGKLASVNDVRDPALPLLLYGREWEPATEGASDGRQ